MTTTPGQVAYDAYQAAVPERQYFPAPAWDSLLAPWQAAWEAAAQAVRHEPARQSLLYVVVMRCGEQYQLCGAYPNEDEAGIHVAHARTIMPDRLFDIRVCPYAETGQAHRQDPPHA